MKTTRTKPEVKKEIKERLPLYIDSYILEGPLEEVAENILKLKDRFKKEVLLQGKKHSDYYKFFLDTEIEYEGGITIYLYGVRLETDEEFTKRIGDNKKAIIRQKLLAKKLKEKKEKAELATFERLMKKYKKS